MRHVFSSCWVRLRALPVLGNERGVVLTMALVVMVLLLGVGSTAVFLGYANLSTSTSLRLASRAKMTAEAQVHEALYRLSQQEGQPGALVPDLTQAFWNDPDMAITIDFTSGDTDPTDGVISTIQPVADWPGHRPADPVVLTYKKPDPTGTPNAVLFYDRDPSLTNPFRTITLPAASIPGSAHPIVQIQAIGLDERGAERQLLVEAAASSAFPPPAPLSSGVDVNLNGAGFLDGTNHDHRIQLGSSGVYGDQGNETTQSHTGNQVEDSPDDNVDTGNGHGIANPDGPAGYDSPPRLFNMQISAADDTPAWVGVTKVNPDTWTGVNQGYASAIALSAGPTVVNDQPPTSGVWQRGVLSWGTNNLTGLGAIPGFPSDCSPGGVPTLVCRPTELTHAADEFDANPHFPTFQEFLGLDDISYQVLLDTPDNCAGNDLPACTTPIGAGVPPVGFTYIKMTSPADEFQLSNVDSPETNNFGLIYVDGSLRINSNFLFKGLIYIEGSLTVSGNPIILGAIMVRGTTSITAGTGNMTLLYSRKAAELGIQAGRPWRVLSWAESEMQG